VYATGSPELKAKGPFCTVSNSPIARGSTRIAKRGRTARFSTGSQGYVEKNTTGAAPILICTRSNASRQSPAAISGHFDAGGRTIATSPSKEPRYGGESLWSLDIVYRIFVQKVRDYAIFMLDPDGIVRNWNAGAKRIEGYESQEIIGQHFSCFYTQEDRAAGRPEHCLKMAQRDGSFETEGWRLRKDGHRFWAHIVIDSIQADGGQLLGFATISRDCTEQRHLEERLAYTANHDALTGLPNRRLFHRNMEQIMESAPVKNEEYNHAALLYIDLDHFKLVNDKLGHHAGDAILKAVSARIAGILRHEDTIARIGGDEFVAILPEVRTRDVTAIADRIIQEIGRPFEIAGRNVTIGLSIGIALLPHDARTEEELIDNADLALSRAKANGRGCYLYYDPELDARTRIEAQ